MEDDLRSTGIDILGEVAWGTHFCNFYATKQDLLDILVPYFKAGLENNEFCLWVTADPVSVADATQALQQAVPNFDRYQKANSIEIVPHDQWYLEEGVFYPDRIIEGWHKKLDHVLELGYAGMRVNGNESWLDQQSWEDFVDYEKELNLLIKGRQLIVLCTFPLSKSNAASILDVALVHEYAVAKRKGKWEIVEIPSVGESKAQINKTNRELEKRVAERARELKAANEELKKEIAGHLRTENALRCTEERYRYLFNHTPACIFIWELNGLKILEVNETAIQQYGYSREEFLQKKILDLSPPEECNKSKEFIRLAKAEADFSFVSAWKHLNKAGKTMYMNLTSHKIIYKELSAVMFLANNVSEKVLLERKLEIERLRQQQEITDAVITAEEKERQEIGRELHDNVNQILASSRLYLDNAKSETKISHPSLDRADELIRTSINEIRNLSHSLVPPSFNELELVETLNHLIEITIKHGKMAVSFDLVGLHEGTIPEKLQLTIYRIVQEQFSNILKHASAKHILIKLMQKNSRLTLSIKDDGIGFDTTQISTGIGLMNIRTRASLFGGGMEIISSPHKGCELKVDFHLPNS